MPRYYPVVRVLSLVIFMFGMTMLVPLLLSWFQHDGAESAFDEAFVLTVATGLGLWWVTRRETRDLTIRDGFLMVALVWTVLPVYAALPLVLQLNLSFTDAYFEAVSGLTTTGATGGSWRRRSSRGWSRTAPGFHGGRPEAQSGGARPRS